MINLKLLDTMTGESSALTQGRHVNLDPAWSPDGTRLLYVSTEADGWYNIHSLPLENGVPGTPVRLTESNAYANDRL